MFWLWIAQCFVIQVLRFGFDVWFSAFLFNIVEPLISQINGTKQKRRLGKGNGEWIWGDGSMVSSYKPGQK